jgi:hypothetical protein
MVGGLRRHRARSAAGAVAVTDPTAPTFDDQIEALGFRARSVTRRGGRRWDLPFNRVLTFMLHDYDDHVVLTWTLRARAGARRARVARELRRAGRDRAVPAYDVRLPLDIDAVSSRDHPRAADAAARPRSAGPVSGLIDHARIGRRLRRWLALLVVATLVAWLVGGCSATGRRCADSPDSSASRSCSRCSWRSPSSAEQRSRRRSVQASGASGWPPRTSRSSRRRSQRASGGAEHGERAERRLELVGIDDVVPARHDRAVPSMTNTHGSLPPVSVWIHAEAAGLSRCCSKSSHTSTCTKSARSPKRVRARRGSR